MESNSVVKLQKTNSNDLRDGHSCASLKKSTRCRSFHFRYLELCRTKNLTPLVDIRTKNNVTTVLDFYGDKLGVTDWLLVMESLYYDQVLQKLDIRMRKNMGSVLDHIDTEKRARLFRQKPVIFTKFIFAGVIEAISNCIEFNKTLRVLQLEGLPLNDKYIEFIAKSMTSNESLKEISFQRSNIQDKGCEAICNTMKYLENIEKLNLSECDLSTKGAEHIAEMIKIQKISRYTDGWQKSLRYRDVDPDTMPGLRMLLLSRNPKIGDDGLKAIVEILKEDVWVKVLEMENCGLTDRGANIVLDCLEINTYIMDFNVNANAGISKFLLRNIREQLGKDEEEQKALELQTQMNINGIGGMPIIDGNKRKTSAIHLREHIKTLEEQLSFERVLRKKAEQLNEKLNQQILAYEQHMEQKANASVPEGYVVVKNESLQSIIRERNEYQRLASNTKVSTKINANIGPIINRFKHMNNLMPSQQLEQKQLQQQQQQLQQQQQQQIDMQLQRPIHDDTLSDFTTSCDETITSTSHIKTPRKILKVRKVKSEMKYSETTSKDSSKKKESKSDHEFANETDYQLKTVQFETNIGDASYLTNKLMNQQQQQQQQLQEQLEMQMASMLSQQTSTPLPSEKKQNFENNKLEIDDLPLSTSRSNTSDPDSNDSDTLRNSFDITPMKVFLRRCSKQQQQQQQQSLTDSFDQSEGKVGQNLKSPRSMFLGLYDD